MIDVCTTLGELQQIYESLTRQEHEEYTLEFDSVEFERFFKDAIMKYAFGKFEKDGSLSGEFDAQRIYCVKTEAYIPYSIAGIYAGRYSQTEEVYEDTRVYVEAYVTEDGELDFYVEEVR
ncbi:MAG TPA: hypothetical protein PKV93_11100 [Fervidobacterium sp.]|nr:hypothetical protein [Fervidobacterium sp.]